MRSGSQEIEMCCSDRWIRSSSGSGTRPDIPPIEAARLAHFFPVTLRAPCEAQA